MNRRTLLGAGAALGAMASAPMAAAAPAAHPTSAAHRLADTLNAEFAKAPVRFDPVARSGRNQVYVTLITTGRDYSGKQKIGGGWHFDLDAHTWRQQKPWISQGTQAQYNAVVDRAQRALIAAL